MTDLNKCDCGKWVYTYILGIPFCQEHFETKGYPEQKLRNEGLID